MAGEPRIFRENTGDCRKAGLIGEGPDRTVDECAAAAGADNQHLGAGGGAAGPVAGAATLMAKEIKG
ncbi:hypothetical protein ACM25N_16430 [Roseovarius sp. C7]|uniref:hypothetical protein n=1 Tax=Roseovarius sp. C7 TaxID=3398643 RepID=UPI0039F65576